MQSLPIAIVVFGVCAAVIGFVGTRLTRVCDRLADRTGLGEALVGAVFLGAATSLPGITASVTAAIDDRPVLALSNAVGGIAAQTVFLIIADFCYRHANLEHAAASLLNLMQGALLIILLAFLVLAIVGPQIMVGHVHIITPMLLIGYALGVRMIHRTHDEPMWQPRMTSQTRVDKPDEPVVHDRVLGQLWLRFAVTAVVVIVAGWLLTRAGEVIATQTGMSDSMVGALGIAVATSLPELVTSIAAVRQGALTLAVGGIIGGNAFDTLFVAVADISYLPGSIYAAATWREQWLIAMTVLMTAVLLLGLLRRQRSGWGNIGFEGAIIVSVYLAGMIAMAAN